MAGHSKFKNIMYRKGAQDQKRARAFTKIIRELTVAAREGADADSNPRLRAAVAAAKSANMGKDTMERAIARGAGGDDSEQYEEIRYEGYGPGGVAVIVEALTDNRNRTAGEVRTAFGKFGGNLGETNSVSFMFDRVGQVSYPPAAASDEDMFEAALEVGARDVRSGADGHEIVSDPDDFHAVRDGIEEKFGASASACLVWLPRSTVPLDEDRAQTLLKLLDALEENDDVRSVDSNVEIDDDVLERLATAR